MRIHRLTALLLSLLLLFSCALAESTDDKLMATVNGEELRYSAYVTYLTQYQQLLSGAYDETDETQAAYIEDLALTTAIQDMLIEQDMRAKGYPPCLSGKIGEESFLCFDLTDCGLSAYVIGGPTGYISLDGLQTETWPEEN